MRFHVHVGVADIESSVAFYSGLFGSAPSVTKEDYAKGMLDDPKINFAISQKDGAAKGVEHLGVQVDSECELAAVYGRLAQAGGPVLEEGKTTCCYAQSEKSWIADPDGVVWEAFLTTGESTGCGKGPDVAALSSANAADNACCAPKVAASAPAPASACC